jgi:hypothetical protein
MTISDKASGSVRSSRSAMLPHPVWKNEQLMVVATWSFSLRLILARYMGMSSTRHFLLGKDRPMIDAII